MSIRVVFRAAANHDIDDAFAWYERQQVGLGDRFVKALGMVVERIRMNPEAYTCVRGVIRRAILPRFPYLLFYVAEAERIVVIACLHASRDPRRWPT